MKTGSWMTYKGAGRIGISCGIPRNAPAGFCLFKPLYPERAWLKLPRPEYEAKYFGKLAELDPKKVVADLERLAGGHEPVLLCWEKPPFTDTNWCHRRMVAEWLEKTIGLRVNEIVVPGNVKPARKQTSLSF